MDEKYLQTKAHTHVLTRTLTHTHTSSSSSRRTSWALSISFFALSYEYVLRQSLALSIALSHASNHPTTSRVFISPSNSCFLRLDRSFSPSSLCLSASSGSMDWLCARKREREREKERENVRLSWLIMRRERRQLKVRVSSYHLLGGD